MRCEAGSTISDDFTRCSLCPAGQADIDSDPGTPCVTCRPGRYAEHDGQVSCTQCPPGTADSDANAATPCTECAVGQYAGAGSAGCHTCNAVCSLWPCSLPCCAWPDEHCRSQGEYDHDLDPATGCAACAPGQSSGRGSTVCTDCPAGYADLDSDPATPCEHCQIEHGHWVTGTRPTSCRQCAPGHADADDDTTTPCEQCPVGKYAGHSVSCMTCPPGTADVDSDPSTPCELCPPGTFSNDTLQCHSCPTGFGDVDHNPATECERCGAGTFTPPGSAACGCCPAGKADLDMLSTTACNACQPGQHTHSCSTACSDCEPVRPARLNPLRDVCKRSRVENNAVCWAGACGPRQRSSVPVRCLPGKSAQASFRWHALDAELPVCRTGGTRREGRLFVRSARQARRTRTQQRPRRVSTAIRARTRTRASSRALSVDPASSITTLIRAHLARIVPRDR